MSVDDIVIRKKPPGSRWRILAWAGERQHKLDLDSRAFPSVFDEIVIDDWFHLEQMDARTWWMAVSGVGQDGKRVRETLWIRIRRDGVAIITHDTESVE